MAKKASKAKVQKNARAKSAKNTKTTAKKVVAKAKTVAKVVAKAKVAVKAKVAKQKTAPVATKPVNFIQEGYHTLTPFLTVNNAAKAIEFYTKVFGAKELTRMPGPNGTIMHAEIKIGDSVVMLADESPEMGNRSPLSLGGTPMGLMLYVKDCDKTFATAVSNGANALMQPADQFWGDRYGRLTDPFGHNWGIGTHKVDLTPKQIEQAGREWAAAQAKNAQHSVAA